MQPFFSIITPVYNAEKYIKKCIKSVQDQSFSDFELILVNDGTPDNSGIICEEYANKDSRIRVFHKNNGGVSSARNLGIEKSCGEFILFLDADDSLMKHTLEVCHNMIANNQLDILQFETCRINKDGSIYKKKVSVNRSFDILPPHEYIERGKYKVCAGGSCIKKEIIDKNGLRFNEKIKLAEDQIFIFSCIINSSRIQFHDEQLYCYLYNPESATNTCKTADIKNSMIELGKFVKRYPVTGRQINALTIDFIIKLINNRDIKYHEIKSLSYTNNFEYGEKLTLAAKTFCILSKVNFYVACYATRILLSINELFKNSRQR